MGSRAHVQAKITDDEVICVKNGLPLGMGPISPQKPLFLMIFGCFLMVLDHC